MDNWSAQSSLFENMPSTSMAQGASGGDVFSTNANRAFAWFIAGIVASVIVSIIFMIMAFVFGIGLDLKQGGLHASASPAVLIVAFILSLGVGFAVAGSVYEGWVGCTGVSS